ncbi:MAG: septal ring lytic transglycosylase RlpA family protein [Thermoleophilia bacterium]|nr:septal ring lytic transglycosylase RlpA family protein [Thermoleophilia bacterium]
MTRLHYLGVISRSDLKVIERLKEEEAEVRRLHSRMDILKQESFQDIGELRQRQAGLKMQVASVSAQLERDNAALEKAWAREAEEEARRAAEESLRLDQDFNLLVGAPAIVAGSIPPPSGLRPSAIVLSGIASWYGPGFHGNRTANGEIYNMNAMTAAHKSLPFGTWLKVTYEDRSVFVRINDRGPYIDGRFLDLSAGSARAIGLTGIGHVKAEIYH